MYIAYFDSFQVKTTQSISMTTTDSRNVVFSTNTQMALNKNINGQGPFIGRMVSKPLTKAALKAVPQGAIMTSAFTVAQYPSVPTTPKTLTASVLSSSNLPQVVAVHVPTTTVAGATITTRLPVTSSQTTPSKMPVPIASKPPSAQQLAVNTQQLLLPGVKSSVSGGAIKSPNPLISSGSQDSALEPQTVAQQPPTTPVLKNVGILMPGSINTSQLGNMAILNPNMATSVAAAAKPISVVASSAAQTGSNTGFSTTLRNVAPPQASITPNTISVQSHPATLQVLKNLLFLLIFTPDTRGIFFLYPAK